MVLNRRVYYEHVMTIRIMAEYKEGRKGSRPHCAHTQAIKI